MTLSSFILFFFLLGTVIVLLHDNAAAAFTTTQQQQHPQSRIPWTTMIKTTTMTKTTKRIHQHQTLTVIQRSASSSSSSDDDNVMEATTTTTTTSATQEDSSLMVQQVQASVQDLKRTLEREYASFFSPMERDYYAKSVTFDDPMTELEGIDSYERNVDMLSGKNIIGKILFRDAGIVLHNIKGGHVTTTTTSNDDDHDETGVMVSDLTTRWTLRLTFQALPWQPTARFSGISVYQVHPGGPKGVQVLKQTDYWDSINLQQNGSGLYQKVAVTKALSDFLQQLLKPATNFAAPSAGIEVPYQLLRRGVDYEVRRYPSFVAVQTPYERRDVGFSILGAFCGGSSSTTTGDGGGGRLNPLAPALMTIPDDNGKDKVMMWPLAYAPPGSDTPPSNVVASVKAIKEQDSNNMWQACDIVMVPERVVAIGSFADASVEPVVRTAHRLLRDACQRDGLMIDNDNDDDDSSSSVTFAQYDAIFSMGQRRGEVWIELKEGQHPWS